MNKSNEWETFFDGHAPLYMGNVFTRNTTREIEFIVEELDLKPGARVLDIGCGTGRHAVQLARLGYAVTGVDLSRGMLAEAEKAAKVAGVIVEWIHADAARFEPEKRFDVALSLCEGAFGLLAQDSDPRVHELSILGNMNRALDVGGKAMLTVLNGLAMIRRFGQEEANRGRFDPLTLSETYLYEYETAEGKRSQMVTERGFVPSELVLMFQRAGLEIQHLWGGTAGNWGRRPIELDEIEIMVIARKVAEPF
jgi:SAM-dependent methyltransferase